MTRAEHGCATRGQENARPDVTNADDRHALAVLVADAAVRRYHGAMYWAGLVAAAIAGFVVHHVHGGRKRKQIVERALREANARMCGRRGTAHDLSIESLIFYGAADLDVKHCTIWILIAGPESQQRIPPWLTLTRQGVVPADKPVEAPLAQWFQELHAQVGDELQRAGWSHATPIVGIESAERVRADSGAYYYWK
jgi:hypothetical protein